MKFPDNIRIRKAIPDDAESIVRIINPIIERGMESVQDLPYSAAFLKNQLENLQPGTIYHVAELKKDNKMVGVAMVLPHIHNIPTTSHNAVLALFVDLNERGKGIGTLLCNQTLETAKKSGFENLQIYIREDNLDLIAFGLKLGFGIIGTAMKQGKCYSKYINIIVMEKIL